MSSIKSEALAKELAIGMTGAFADLTCTMPIMGTIALAQATGRPFTAVARDILTRRPGEKHPYRRALRQSYAGFGEEYGAYGPNVALAFVQRDIYQQSLAKNFPNLSDNTRLTIAAGVAGALTGALWSTPLENVMVKKQIAANSGAPITLAHVVREYARRKNPLGLYQGGSLVGARESIYHGMVAAPKIVQSKMDPQWVHDHQVLADIGAAIPCGVAGAVLTNGINVVKTQMQATFERMTCKQAASHVWKTLGVRACTNGLDGRLAAYTIGVVNITLVERAIRKRTSA